MAQTAPGKNSPEPIQRQPNFAALAGSQDDKIDFVTAINAHYSQGISPEDNAASLLYQAFGPTPDDYRLSPRFFKWLGIPVPPDKGRYFVSLKQFEDHSEPLLTLFKEYYRPQWTGPWTPGQMPVIDRWLKLNEEPMRIAERAVLRPKYFLPQDHRVGNMGLERSLSVSPLPGVQQSAFLADAFTARAMRYAGMRQFDKCARDIMTCYRLGRHVSNGSSLIELIVGGSIEKRATYAARAWMMASPDRDACLQFIREFDSLPRRGTTCQAFAVHERALLMNAVQLLCESKWREFNNDYIDSYWSDHHIRLVLDVFDGYLDRELISTRCNEWCDRLVKASGSCQFEELIAEYAVILEERDAMEQRLHTTNYDDIKRLPSEERSRAASMHIADFIIMYTGGGPLECWERDFLLRQTTINLKVLLAAAAFKAEQGDFPEDLAQLVNDIPDLSVTDIYACDPVVFLRNESGCKVISLGYDGRENGFALWPTDASDDLIMTLPDTRRALSIWNIRGP